MPERHIDLADERILTTSGIHAHIHSNRDCNKLVAAFSLDSRWIAFLTKKTILFVDYSNKSIKVIYAKHSILKRFFNAKQQCIENK